MLPRGLLPMWTAKGAFRRALAYKRGACRQFARGSRRQGIAVLVCFGAFGSDRRCAKSTHRGHAAALQEEGGGFSSHQLVCNG